MTGVQISPYEHENANKVFINTMLMKIEDIGITDEEVGTENEKEDI